jgi:NTE family protein
MIKRRRFLAAMALAALAAAQPLSAFGPGPESAALPVLSEDDFLTDVLWSQFRQAPPEHRPRIGLVLGGGGARGLAHIGVLKVFEEAAVPVDLVVGTSVGAIIGGLYCAGVPVSSLENLASETGWDKLSNISRLSVVRLFLLQNLLSTEKLGKLLGRLMQNKRFDQLERRFACVSTDIRTGERIIFKEGDLEPAVRASATIPGAFNPVEYRHRYLVDGGVVDNLPTDIAKLMGADFVIAVQVQTNPSPRKPSNIMETLAQVIMVQGYETARKREELADFVLRPDVSDVSIFDLGRSKDCVSAGIKGTRGDLVPLMKKILEKAFNRWQLARDAR